MRRRKPEARVVAFVGGQSLYISAVTLAKIRFSIELVSAAGRGAELNNWLTHKARPVFEQRVLGVTEAVMFKWRLLVEDGREAGHTFSQPDLILAATAREHGLTLVSQDTRDYEKARVPVIKSWSRKRLSCRCAALMRPAASSDDAPTAVCCYAIACCRLRGTSSSRAMLAQIAASKP